VGGEKNTSIGGDFIRVYLSRSIRERGGSPEGALKKAGNIAKGDLEGRVHVAMRERPITVHLKTRGRCLTGTAYFQPSICEREGSFSKVDEGQRAERGKGDSTITLNGGSVD